jgi:hypothetical protein
MVALKRRKSENSISITTESTKRDSWAPNAAEMGRDRARGRKSPTSKTPLLKFRRVEVAVVEKPTKRPVTLDISKGIPIKCSIGINAIPAPAPAMEKMVERVRVRKNTPT